MLGGAAPRPGPVTLAPGRSEPPPLNIFGMRPPNRSAPPFLAERPGGALDAAGPPVLGMTRTARVELAERLQIVEGDRGKVGAPTSQAVLHQPISIVPRQAHPDRAIVLLFATSAGAAEPALITHPCVIRSHQLGGASAAVVCREVVTAMAEAVSLSVPTPVPAATRPGTVARVSIR